MKVAIVTDWLTNMGGAERVVLELHRMFPDAPIYTSLYDEAKMPLFAGADIRPSWLNHIPWAKKKHQMFTLPRGWYFKHLNLDAYDLVISASGAEAKAVRTGPKTVHINYCHAPTHYYWVRPEEYLANPGFGWFDPVMRLGLKFMLKRRRVWDYLAAQEADLMIANSSITKARIEQFYDRHSVVVFPAVDLDRFANLPKAFERYGFITVGRQVHYMRRDLAVIACTRLNLPLTVIGNGPEHQKLVDVAGPTVRFITDATDEVVAEELAKAEGFIFPGVEDFGIVAVEAMAAGTPVIAIHDGGALDSVVEGISGTFFAHQNVRSLMRVLKSFHGADFDEATIKKHAEVFSADHFVKNMHAVIDKAMSKKNKTI